MPKDFGEWVLGEEIKQLELHIEKPDKTAFDLTGYTVTLVRRHPNDPTDLADLLGVIASPATLGKVTFDNLTSGLDLATAKEKRVECRAMGVKAGEDGWSEEGFYTVKRFP